MKDVDLGTEFNSEIQEELITHTSICRGFYSFNNIIIISSILGAFSRFLKATIGFIFFILRSCDRASWHVAVHRDMWPCIVTCDRASWHVTVHRDMWPCIVTNLFIIKPTRCTNFTNLFWHETLHVSDSSSVHHQEFIHCTLSNGICHTGL
jgi:hypothetical protein